MEVKIRNLPLARFARDRKGHGEMQERLRPDLGAHQNLTASASRLRRERKVKNVSLGARREHRL